MSNDQSIHLVGEQHGFRLHVVPHERKGRKQAEAIRLMRDQFLLASTLTSTICEVPGTGGRGENEIPCSLPIRVSSLFLGMRDDMPGD